MKNINNINKFRGCLIGGAVGDALGYAVEFISETEIFCRYGKNGITEYCLKDGVAEISDDTQMTLFTAYGLIARALNGRRSNDMGAYLESIRDSYKDWYRTQHERFPLKKNSVNNWLLNISELFNCRAPGGTCLSAIRAGADGTIDRPINDSKGCGGIMRVAPIGLYFDKQKVDIYDIDKMGACVAALTHGHELGYIPAAAFTHIINLVAHDNEISLLDAVIDMKKSISRQFVGCKHLQEQIVLIDKAIELSNKDMTDIDAIGELGQGWVAEETLAIALYCSLKYSENFEKAIIAAVNHRGDSDSTGAVAGNILGAYLGLAGIPYKYLDKLELKDVIIRIADNLYNVDNSKSSYNEA